MHGSDRFLEQFYICPQSTTDFVTTMIYHRMTRWERASGSINFILPPTPQIEIKLIYLKQIRVFQSNHQVTIWTATPCGLHYRAAQESTGH